MTTTAPSQPELSRMIKVRPLPGDPVIIEANASECAALAGRFGLSSVERLNGTVSLKTEASSIIATGTLEADWTQTCAVSGEDFPISLSTPISLRFVRESTLHAEKNEDGEIEIDLSVEDSDEIEYSGETFDLGEALAQTLGLSIDPYAEGPEAQAAREAAGISGDDAPSGPLAEALAALKKG